MSVGSHQTMVGRMFSRLILTGAGKGRPRLEVGGRAGWGSL